MSDLDLMWKFFVLTMTREKVSEVATDMAGMRKDRANQVSKELAEYLMFVGTKGSMTLDMPNHKETI